MMRTPSPAVVRAGAVMLFLTLALAGCGSSSSHRSAASTTTGRAIVPTLPTATTSPSATSPAGGSAVCGFLQPGKTSYRHVIWIWMENHSYSSVIGSPLAPFENQLAGECGLATNYHNITHPSLPNYVGGTSGLPIGSLGPFASDCSPSASCSAGPGVASIFSQVPDWKAYEQSMPSNCYRSNAGDYAVRHNPPLYFQGLAGSCPTNDVPFTEFSSDLTGGRLPKFSFVTPDVAHDMHNGSVATGDRWLNATVSQIVDSAAYRSGTIALFITWDEGEGGTANNCATNTTDSGCHVATIVVAPTTAPGTRSAVLFNHYSLLRTAEDLLGVAPIGQAANANPMDSAFGLGG